MDSKNGTVVDVEPVKGHSLMYYRGPEKSTFLKITLSLPTLVAPCRGEEAGEEE